MHVKLVHVINFRQSFKPILRTPKFEWYLGSKWCSRSKLLRNSNLSHGNFFSYILQCQIWSPIQKNGDHTRPAELRITRAIPHIYSPESTITSITWWRCEFIHVWEFKDSAKIHGDWQNLYPFCDNTHGQQCEAWYITLQLCFVCFLTLSCAWIHSL